MSTQLRKPGTADRDPDMAGAEAAMHRAARRARQRAALAATLPTLVAEGVRTTDEALQAFRATDQNGAAAHVRGAFERIEAGDWTGAVRESSRAVASVARQLHPDAAKTLDPALQAIERHGVLHPALKDAVSKLYSYTSDERGVRHALLDRPDARIGRDEAVFMLGACVAFASYLWRKHAAGGSR